MEKPEKIDFHAGPVKIRVHETPYELSRGEARRAEQKIADLLSQLKHAGASETELASFNTAAEDFRREVEESNRFLKDNSGNMPEFPAIREKAEAPENNGRMHGRMEHLSGLAEILEAGGYPAASREVEDRLEKIREHLNRGKDEAAERKLTRLTEELKRTHPGLFFEAPRGGAEPPADLPVSEAEPPGVEEERRGGRMRTALHRELEHINPEAAVRRTPPEFK